jgi:putative hydrolase of the HAD superfamily
MSSSPVLVLDIDGVVTVARPGSWHANLTTDLGLDYGEIQHGFFRKDWQEVVRGRLDLYVALHNYFEPKGMADKIDAFVRYWFEKDAVIDRAVLATNQEHHRATYLRDQAGLGAHFDEIVYSAALGVCKPERVFFTNAQARMGVAVAQSILFVDDKVENVDGARMCGWRAMLYRGPESLARALIEWK